MVRSVSRHFYLDTEYSEPLSRYGHEGSVTFHNVSSVTLLPQMATFLTHNKFSRLPHFDSVSIMNQFSPD